MATLPEETPEEKEARLRHEEEERLRRLPEIKGVTDIETFGPRPPPAVEEVKVEPPEEKKEFKAKDIVEEEVEKEMEAEEKFAFDDVKRMMEAKLRPVVEESKRKMYGKARPLIGKLEKKKFEGLKFGRAPVYKSEDEIKEEEEKAKEKKAETGKMISDLLAARKIKGPAAAPLTAPGKYVSPAKSISTTSSFMSPAPFSSPISALTSSLAGLSMKPPAVTSSPPLTSTPPPASTLPLPSTPPSGPPKVSGIVPEETFESLFNDEEHIKKHYENLDKTTLDFVDTYFRPEDRPQVAFMLGKDQLTRLNDPDFLENVLEEINDDIAKYNLGKDPADQFTLIDVRKANKGFSDPDNQRELAYAINLYSQKFKNPEKLNWIFSFDPTGTKVLKKEDIAQFAAKSHMQEQDPALLIDRYIQNLLWNIPEYDVPSGLDIENPKSISIEIYNNQERFKNGEITEEELNRRNSILDLTGNRAIKIKDLRDAAQQMDYYKASLENGDIDDTEFEESVSKLYEDLNYKYGGDPAFIDTLKHIKVRTFQDIEQFNSYLRKLDTLIKSNPSNAVTIELSKLIENVIQDIRDGKIDIHQAYKKLSTIEPIKQAFELKPAEEVQELKAETIESEEPEIDLTTLHRYYSKVKKEHLLGLAGIQLKGFPTLIANENVYDLSKTELENLQKNVQDVVDANKLNKTDFRSKKKLKDENLLEFGEKLISDLSSIGMDLSPEVFPFVHDIEIKNQNASETRKHLIEFLKQFNKNLNFVKDLYLSKKSLTDQMETDINDMFKNVDDEYKIKIDDEKDTTAKEKLERQRDALKIKQSNDIKTDYNNRNKTKIKKSLTAMKKIKSQPDVPIMRKVAKTTHKIVKVPKAKPAKIIIPAGLAKQRAEDIKKYAEKAIYAKETSKHEPLYKRSTYGQYVIEFNVQTDEDILRMLKEIKPLQGKLYMVDLPTGRLHPIELDKVIKGATYVFQKDLPSEVIGGGLVHSSSAYHPILSSILRDDERLFPQVWMQNGNDKIPAFFPQLGNPKNNHINRMKDDYRDQMRNLIGGSIWKSVKHGLKGMGQDVKGYIVDNSVNAAKTLAKQTVGEAKNFVQQEKQNINYIGNANKRLYKNPSFSNLNRAINRTVLGSTKLVTQPAFTSARELANISDFASAIPGLNVAKYAAEYALPPLAVADSAIHATRDLGLGSNQKAKYLDAAINGLDAVLGTGKLSGGIEKGTKALNLGLKVADAFTDKHDASSATRGIIGV